ncbi:MAG: diaminopimelate epimerase [Thermodesulfobacteriota bacterium]
MHFVKYHALGNDYIVWDPARANGEPTLSQTRLLCHRNYGVGSDGVLVGPLERSGKIFSVRIFNPDGSEAEKSGNGLRIFSRYLWDQKMVGEEPFTIFTKGGQVTAQIQKEGREITIAMGALSFDSTLIPVEGPPREVINEILTIEGNELRFCAATIGNPHCVVLRDELDVELVKKWGPLIEVDPRFPYRTNVQFMKILDRENIQIEIWERGAGYTLASGTSSSAAAGVAHKLGLCDAHISVHSPGGILYIAISNDYKISLRGPVTKIAEGNLAKELFTHQL